MVPKKNKRMGVFMKTVEEINVKALKEIIGLLNGLEIGGEQLVKEKIKLVGAGTTKPELLDAFLRTAESISEEDEDKLVESGNESWVRISDFYNSITSSGDEGEEGAGDPPPKPEKAHKAPKPGKVETVPKPEKAGDVKRYGLQWKDGSGCQLIYLSIVNAGDKGITREEAVKKLKNTVKSTNLEGKVKVTFGEAVGRGLAKVVDGRYFAI